MAIKEALLEQLQQMDENQQAQVLNFARIIARTPRLMGEPGRQIAQATGYFDPESLEEINAAIQEESKRIDWGGWE